MPYPTFWFEALRSSMPHCLPMTNCHIVYSSYTMFPCSEIAHIITIIQSGHSNKLLLRPNKRRSSRTCHTRKQVCPYQQSYASCSAGCNMSNCSNYHRKRPRMCYVQKQCSLRSFYLNKIYTVHYTPTFSLLPRVLTLRLAGYTPATAAAESGMKFFSLKSFFVKI